MKTTTKTLSAFAGLTLITGTASAGLISGDGVASFDFNNGGTIMSGDVTLNADGLSITGQVGDWTDLPVSTRTGTTEEGVSLTFASTFDWQSTVGNREEYGNGAIRIGTFLGNPGDITFTIGGLDAGESYNIIFYNKNLTETRHPNVGIDGFDAGNGVGAAGPIDGDRDQNFAGVVANGSGQITGTWFLSGSTQDISAIAGVQIESLNNIPEPGSLALMGLGGLLIARRRRG